MPRDCQVKAVRGPDGETVTLSNIPVGNPKRWLPAMKARVVAAVEGGLISIEDASRRYRLSRQEYATWRKAVMEEHLGSPAPASGLDSGRRVVDELLRFRFDRVPASSDGSPGALGSMVPDLDRSVAKLQIRFRGLH